VQQLRARTDAVAVGSETLLADDPELVARRGGRIVHLPLRVVVDSRLRTPPIARILDPANPGSALVLTAADAPASRRKRLERAGAKVVPVRKQDAISTSPRPGRPSPTTA